MIQAAAAAKLSLLGAVQATGAFAASTISTSLLTSAQINVSSISTNTLTAQTLSSLALNISSINGQTPVGFSTMISTVAGLNSNISSMIDPTELTSSIVGLGTSGFVSSLGLTFAIASTAQGLGTLGYTSTSQLLSTTVGVYSQIATSISASNTPQFISTVQGLGTTGYISTATLTSTVIGLTSQTSTVAATAFTGSTTSLSAATIFVSSLAANALTTAQINVSSISTNTLISQTLSSLTMNASTLNVNNLTILGTQTINSNGSLATSAYGSGVDTLALKTTLSQYNGGIASLFFGTSTLGYPLARIAALDGSISGPDSSALVFQTALASANANTSGVNIFQYTGANQSWTAPGGVTSVSVYLWGAGGGSAQAGNAGFYGGAGAFVSGTLTVIPGRTYNVIVGGAGQIALFNGAAQPATFGGGGAGGGPAGGNQNSGGSGGGRSAIQITLSVTATGVVSGGNIVYTTSGTHSLTVGEVVVLTNLSPNAFNITAAISSLTTNTFTIPNNTAATGSSAGTGTILVEIVDAAGGGGAGNSTGGTGTMGVITSGTARGVNLTGGNGLSVTGGGGGGGYYGGGGGGTNSGGSGGTSYTAAAEFTLVSAINSPNSAYQAPGTANSYYIAYGAASNVAAAVQFLSGGPGLVVIVSAPSSFLSETMRISNNGFLGIGTASPSTLLDVAGTSRSQGMSTLSFNTSSINGIPFGAQALGVQTLAF